MKWKQRFIVLVAVLVLMLVARGLWGIPGDKEEHIVSIQHGQPFYPVYFATEDAQFLVPEFRAGQQSIAQLLVDLVDGPRLPHLVSILPAETRVINYVIQGSVLFVNFSHHLVSNHPGGSAGEILTVYGIVNTLVGIEGIERVQILVENERRHTLVGHLLIREPLQKDYRVLNSGLI